MRHYLLACPALPLAPGVGMTAFAAVLVAFASSTLGASSGLARTSGAAIALTPVAVAADGDSAAAAGAHKEPGWRLGGGHGRSCPCVKPTSGQPRSLCEILHAQRRPSEWGARGATVCLPASYRHCRACFLHRLGRLYRKVQRRTCALTHWHHPTAKTDSLWMPACLSEGAPPTRSNASLGKLAGSASELSVIIEFDVT